MSKIVFSIAALLLICVAAAVAQTIQGTSPGFTGASQLIFSLTSSPWIATSGGSGFGLGVAAGPAVFISNTQTIGFNVSAADIGIGDGPNGVIKWWPGAISGSPDTSLTRKFPAILAIGNGTVGNTSGGYITGTASLTSLTTGTNADFLCLAADGTVLLQNAACTISSLRFKPDWKPYKDDALTKVSQLDVGTFHTETGANADPNAKSLQAGLNAEDVAKIAPECAIYENDMKTPKSYRQECVIALLVKAIQQLHDK